MRRFIIILATIAAVFASVAPVATAGPINEVTLKAGKSRMKVGEWVKLSGRVQPAIEGQPVTIVDRDAGPIADTTTDADGRYQVRYRPARTLRVHAESLGARSPAITIRVAFRVKVGMRKVALFNKAKVTGVLEPAEPGESILVRLVRFGKVVAKKRVKLFKGHSFKTRFHIGKPGNYRAKVRYDDKEHMGDSDSSRRRTTHLPSLSTGSRGPAVKRLERRLRSLGYYIPTVDRSYGTPTHDAIIAFNKIQRRARIGSVDANTWRALASPKRARPRAKSPRNHIEINQTRQVVMFVRKGKVKWILHSSTGAGGATHDGVYRVHRKIAGYSGGRLYYPSYFDGLRAIHGWPEVPTYPASHGCARIPMWAATWAHGKAPMGIQVRVYH
ncbi:MAG: L,D-transpeptidase family protein [Actinomycetota bacterium]